MKKSGIKRLAAWFFALLFAAELFMPGTGVVRAENPQNVPGVYINEKMTLYMDYPGAFTLFGFSKLKVVSNLKSSNKKVATVSKSLNPVGINIDITPKKPGKTKISFDLKYKKKTYHFKCTVVVKEYESPFKSCKLGTVNLKKKLDKASKSSAVNVHVPIKKTLKKKKLSFKLNKGWKLLEVSLHSDGELKYIENGDKITVKKGDEIDFQITDPQGNDLWFYYFFE